MFSMFTSLALIIGPTSDRLSFVQPLIGFYKLDSGYAPEISEWNILWHLILFITAFHIHDEDSFDSSVAEWEAEDNASPT